MKNIPLTESSRLRLLLDTEVRISEISKEIDGLRQFLWKADQIVVLFKKEKIVFKIDNFIKLTNFRMFIGLIILDLGTASRIYFNAKLNYEKLYAARQIIIIINEAYKKIFHYLETDKGKQKSKYRENSFWIKNIGQIIDQDMPNLRNRYNTITLALENYLSNHKDQRDIFVHYDYDPAKLYDALISIDIEVIFRKMIGFLEILNRMYNFSEELVRQFKLQAEIGNSQSEVNINELMEHFKKLKKIEKPGDTETIKENLEIIKSIINKKLNPTT